MTRYSKQPLEDLDTGKSSVMGRDWRSLWSLDPKITFLNHGSFGACPLAVLERQQILRSQMEQEPVRFFALELEPLLDTARQDLATFLNADAADLAFVPNATTGVNTVLRSLCLPNASLPNASLPNASRALLQPGDELLTTNHEYNACRNALDFAAQISGATIVTAEVPFPIDAPEEAIAAVLDKVSPRTRLVLIDHVTSQTGLVFPLQTLVRQLTDVGIEVLVDGAHAPGMIDLNLKVLGATYYTGNCHKWLCAPKGAAFLYVQADRHSHLRPLTISHGANSPRSDRSRFRLEFDWTGTADPTPYLCIPEAIQFMGSLLPEGWEGLRQHNRATVLAAREVLGKALAVDLPCPDSMIGSMAVVPLPNGSAEHLQASLFQRHLEVPVIPWQGSANRLLRISAQIYNTPADYDALAEAMLVLIKEEKGI